MKKTQLVIMAAGLGSRYGGLKQMDPVDPQGQFIIDYSIYDALRAGFDEIICIVKPENEALFRETVGSRVGSKAKLIFAHQRPDVLPEGFSIPEGRVKPWGTAHAVLCAKPLIDSPFCVINADDFYGASAFQTIHDFLIAEHTGREYAMVGYRVENTLTENGHVARGELPLRVTHNDTKLNNVMLDAKTRTPLCVIDLDTVMPGLAGNDFGDSIRFGANTAAEDERDLSKVRFSMPLFEAYAQGFLSACGKALTPAEIKTLPLGAKLMTLECGVRFLTDYLAGDTYFRVHREGHNLDRCRTQFKLVSEMENQWSAMESAIGRIAENSI